MFEDLKFYLLKFIFNVETKIVLPEHKGSSIRGALLGSLRKSFCLKPREEFCAQCVLKDTCPISILLSYSTDSLSRYNYPPRPFLIKPPLEKKNEYNPREEFIFTLGFFGEDIIKNFSYVIAGARLMGRAGIGVIENRGRMNLIRVLSINPIKNKEEEIFQEIEELRASPSMPIDTNDIKNRSKEIVKISKIKIRFLTPVRLISEKKLLGPLRSPSSEKNIPFSILYRRLLERLTTLIKIYEGKKIELDFQKLIEDSQKIKQVKSNLIWADVFRYSSRQQTKLPMGGYVGDIIYEGNFENFAETLAWGEQIHVGKYAILGNGWYEMAGVLDN